jgi:hypothetical protein
MAMFASDETLNATRSEKGPYPFFGYGSFSGLVLCLCVLACVAARGAQSAQQPARDTPAQPAKDAPPPPSGRITGRVITNDTGRPIKRARVYLSAPELPDGRAMLTDDTGIYDIVELPAGRYSISVSKPGFVSLSYGQRRPLQPGTPLQLADGQQIKGVDFSLPRGSVVAGRVLDEEGDPMPGASVRVMRYQYMQGDRRLMPAGSAQTDDKGQYRVWGLMPGDYYVSAVVRSGNFRGRGGGTGSAGEAEGEEALAYAPTYFPGVPSVDEAKPVVLGLGQEVLEINFNLQLVRTSRISGRVTNPDGTAATSGNVTLIADAASTRGSPLGTRYGGRIDWDGSFAMSQVPPGRYLLRASSDDTGVMQFASQPLSVGNGDLSDVLVLLAPGASISGTIAFPATKSAVPDLAQIRIAAPSLDAGVQGQANARVDKQGRFVFQTLAAGPHLLRAQGPLRGWSLKSVTLDGRDVTDVPIELRSGQQIANVQITFTDLQSEIDGTVTGDHDQPITDYTLLAFSTDSDFWRPLSRQILTARPDQNGKFKIHGLPAGEYYLVPVDPSEQGEWFDPAYLDAHRAGATRLTLGDGETKVANFKIKN